MTDYKQALVDLLAEVPMPAITRHWADEYLSHLDDGEALRDDIEEILEGCESEFAFYASSRIRAWRRKYA